jgi:hypothetical protein
MSGRIERWKTTWESRDVDAVVGMYAPDATDTSALVATRWPELGRTTLRGHDEIREYLRRGLPRFRWLRFDVATVTEAPERSAVDYLRQSDLDGDDPPHVLELLEWDGELLRAVRVFHL